MNENGIAIFEIDFNATILFYVAMAISAISLMVNVLFINKLVCIVSDGTLREAKTAL